MLEMTPTKIVNHAFLIGDEFSFPIILPSVMHLSLPKTPLKSEDAICILQVQNTYHTLIHESSDGPTHFYILEAVTSQGDIIGLFQIHSPVSW